jgi:hypothetical protein
MTTGALIFAFNNNDIDYLAMAAWSARNIRRHLDIPVAVVTNATPTAGDFDYVISAEPEQGGTRYFDDFGKNVLWYNAGRTDAYDLTPFEQTLVLDADYIVASSQLKSLLVTQQEFLCHRTAFDVATANSLDSLNHFGIHQMPMWWATVMLFKKSNMSQYIFDCMKMIKQNWQHYRDLYGIQKSTYRNDFALSIALGIVSGQTWQVDEIPWQLASVMPKDKIKQIDQDHYEITFLDQQNTPKSVSMSGFDIHAMGKRYLGDIIESN